MKINISGYEAVERGLHAGGVERLVCHVTGEPLHNAEQAISEGSFFASRNHKTATIIYEKDVEVLRYLNEKREVQRAGLEIIILGRELTEELLGKLQELHLPLMIAENAKDILLMTADAMEYSELRRVPVAVYIPVRLLRCRKAVTIDGRYYCDDMEHIPTSERHVRVIALEKRYNRIYHVSRQQADAVSSKDDENEDAHGGRTLIIVVSGCAGTVNEIAAIYKRIYMCKLDMPFAEISELLLRTFRHFIIIGHGTVYIKEMMKQKGLISDAARSIELSGDKMYEAREIYTALKGLLPGSGAGSVHAVSDINESELSSSYMHRLPEELISNMMCASCPYRSGIRSIMRKSPGTSVYEDIYCSKRGTMVRSGIHSAPSAYAAGLVITNRKEIPADMPNARYMDCECMK